MRLDIRCGFANGYPWHCVLFYALIWMPIMHAEWWPQTRQRLWTTRDGQWGEWECRRPAPAVWYWRHVLVRSVKDYVICPYCYVKQMVLNITRSHLA